jgi:hypothetical protein
LKRVASKFIIVAKWIFYPEKKKERRKDKGLKKFRRHKFLSCFAYNLGNIFEIMKRFVVVLK